MNPTDFAGELTFFLSTYLPSQRNASPNTIKSYRDTFALFLQHCQETSDLTPERLSLGMITVPLILEFLDALESARGCGATTRNIRLAAIHSFFRFLQPRYPERLLQCQQILSIPSKRHVRPAIRYLSVAEIGALLAQPGLQTRQGLRDSALLSLLYDTGARVQEVSDVQTNSLRLQSPPQVNLTGKGRKRRVVPLLPATCQLITDYLQQYRIDINSASPLFFNCQGGQLSTAGIRHILSKYARRAKEHDPNFPSRITPHVLRHSKAMHLLHAGAPLPVVQALLGHADIRTTLLYARASLEQVREALQKSPQTITERGATPWRRNTGLMAWLKSL